MSSGDSPGERYLRNWHVRHPDASRVFIDARDSSGRTSYDRLASLVPESAVVLDIACGTGTLAALIHDSIPMAQLAGIDLSESELGLAIPRVSGAVFAVAYAQTLPFADGSFDVVLCHMALMLMERPQDAIAEFRRVLRSGGRFGAVLNRAAPLDATAKAILKSLRPAWERGSSGALHPPTLGDPRTLDGDALTSLMNESFDDVSIEPFDVVRHVPRAGLWPFLVDSLYGLDAIPESEARSILDDLALPDPVLWTTAMVQVQGHT